MNIINKTLLILMLFSINIVNAVIPSKSTLYYRMHCILGAQVSLQDTVLIELRDINQISMDYNTNYNKKIQEYQIPVDKSYKQLNDFCESNPQNLLEISKLREYYESELSIFNEKCNKLNDQLNLFSNQQSFLMNLLWVKLTKVLESVAKELDACAAIPVITHSESNFFYIDPEYDITDRIINLLNKEYLDIKQKR